MTEFAEKPYGTTGAEINIKTDKGENAGSVIVTEKGKRVKIGNVHVNKDFRGLKFGEKLLGAAEEWAAGRNFHEIYGMLTPVPGGERALLEALQKRGYEVNFKTGIVKKKI
jgi:GNAT superfamily N-acetyltransferase